MRIYTKPELKYFNVKMEEKVACSCYDCNSVIAAESVESFGDEADCKRPPRPPKPPKPPVTLFCYS